jgi:hypothetical protein
VARLDVGVPARNPTAGWPWDEGLQNLVAKFELLLDTQRPVSEDPLTQFARSASSAATVDECEVVEYEQIPGLYANLDLNALQIQAASRKELRLPDETRELGAAEELGVVLDARQHGQPAQSGFDDSREAALDVAGVVTPGAVTAPVGGEPADQLGALLPPAAGEQRTQWYQARERIARQCVGPDVQGGEARHVAGQHWNQRETEIEMQSLEVAARWPAGRWDHELADDLKPGLGARLTDDLHRRVPRITGGRERSADMHEAGGAEISLHQLKIRARLARDADEDGPHRSHDDAGGRRGSTCGGDC